MKPKLLALAIALICIGDLNAQGLLQSLKKLAEKAVPSGEHGSSETQSQETQDSGKTQKLAIDSPTARKKVVAQKENLISFPTQEKAEIIARYSAQTTELVQKLKGVTTLREKKIGFKGIFLGENLNKNPAPQVLVNKCQSLARTILKDEQSQFSDYKERKAVELILATKNVIPDDFQLVEDNFGAIWTCDGKISLFQRETKYHLEFVNDQVVFIGVSLNNEDVPLMVDALSNIIGPVTKQDVLLTAAQVRENSRQAMLKDCDNVAKMFDDNPMLANSEVATCKRQLPAKLAMLSVPKDGIRILKGRWNYPNVSAQYETASDEITEFAISYEPYTPSYTRWQEAYAAPALVSLVKKAGKVKVNARQSDF